VIDMPRITPDKIVSFYWLLIDTSHSSWRDVIEGACSAKHVETHPKNNLSIYLNNSGTRAIVKVTEGTPAWKAAQSWSSAVLKTYTETDHSEVQELMQTSDWVRPVSILPRWLELGED
jgi:hypothetical protein